MGITLQEFYTFLIELAFCVLFLIVFLSIHYSLNNVKKIRNGLNKNKVAKFFYFFILGALLASLSFVVSQLCAKTLGTFIGLPVIILSLIFAMSFFYGFAVQMGAIIPSALWVIWAYGGMVGTNVDLIARLLIILLYIVASYCFHLYKEKKWTYFIIGSIMMAGTIILSIVIVQDDRLLYHTLETIIGILMSFLFLAIIKGFSHMSKNITNIALNAIYSDKHYLVPESLDLNFTNFIRSNNINQALVIMFEIKDQNNPQAKQMLLDSIYNAFHKKDCKTLFFKTEYNKYGIVVSGKDFYINNLSHCFKGNLFEKRLEKDNLYKLEQIINSIPLTYEYFNDKYTFNMRTYVSVYGVHGYDINELISHNMFMINNEDETVPNRIKIFNSEMVEFVNEDEIDYATLVQNVNLDEITITLELIKLGDSNKTYVYPRVYWLKKMLGDYKSITKTLPPKTAQTLLRSLAIKSIELYTESNYKGKYDLIINYPWEELNTVFYSVNNAIRKIKLFGVNPDNVIFCFDVYNIREWPRNVLKHLTEFEERKLQYMVLNVNSSTIFNAHKPLISTLSDYVINNNTKLTKIMKVVKKRNVNVLSTINKQ